MSVAEVILRCLFGSSFYLYGSGPKEGMQFSDILWPGLTQERCSCLDDFLPLQDAEIQHHSAYDR
jgi:hypothetical protein